MLSYLLSHSQQGLNHKRNILAIRRQFNVPHEGLGAVHKWRHPLLWGKGLKSREKLVKSSRIDRLLKYFLSPAASYLCNLYAHIWRSTLPKTHLCCNLLIPMLWFIWLLFECRAIRIAPIVAHNGMRLIMKEYGHFVALAYLKNCIHSIFHTTHLSKYCIMNIEKISSLKCMLLQKGFEPIVSRIIWNGHTLV